MGDAGRSGRVAVVECHCTVDRSLGASGVSGDRFVVAVVGEMRTRRRFRLKLAAGLLVAIVAYAAAYLAMTPLPGEHGTYDQFIFHDTGDGFAECWIVPPYPNRLLLHFFWIAYAVDQYLRPDIWNLYG